MAKRKSVSVENIVYPETSVDQASLNDYTRGMELEWLETNGLGGYASSTVIGMNTRRYHGLLVAALEPPAGRMVLLAKMDETVSGPYGDVQLGTNMYPNAIVPEGFKKIVSFSLEPFPRWVFDTGYGFLEKTFVMPHGYNSGALRYRWIDENGNVLEVAPEGIRLSVRPFLAFRDYHHVARFRDWMTPAVRDEAGLVSMRPVDGLPELLFRAPELNYIFQPDWYYNFEYELERRRGMEYTEDLLCPGYFATSGNSAEFDICFAAGHDPMDCIAGLENMDGDTLFSNIAREEVLRRKSLIRTAGSPKSEITKKLIVSSDVYIVQRGHEGNTILAGYHWFTDWGRDTMIALPGLAIATGRLLDAKNILATFARYIKNGLIPNRFPDAGETPDYNTVDASLWYIIAADSYMRATWDESFLREQLWDALKQIVRCYSDGTDNGIFMDEDGLITAGRADTQLTWMDAKVGDWVVTSRYGKAVEINALWYNALRILERLAPRVGESGDDYNALARRVAKEFGRLFWNPDAGCLYDVVNENGPDASIRPNQIFALSLPRALLTADKRMSVLKVVEKHLVTPFGLRSLSPEDPKYCGTYAGGVLERDGAYHQGTVWGWLLGHYISALLNVSGRTTENIGKIKAIVGEMEKHVMMTGGLNHVSEIFDGDAPHTSRGCIAQAWSVAELLRAKMKLDKL